MREELEEGVLSDAEIPKDGIVITLDKEKFGYWILGDVAKGTERAGMAIYRLMSYFNGDGEKMTRAVDTITGRVN